MLTKNQVKLFKKYKIIQKSGFKMIKRFSPVAVFLAAPAVSCNAVKFEISEGIFTFLLDAQNDTAVIRHICITSDEKSKVVVVPPEIGFKYFGVYTVTEILLQSVEDIFEKIEKIILPQTLIDNENNRKTLNFLKGHKINIEWGKKIKEKEKLLSGAWQK